MSATKGRDSPLGSQDAADESLPLYEEFQISETPAATLPSETATSNEVRDYLASLLKNKHNLADDHVRRVVSRWTIGTGRELRSYTPQMYLGIFGREDGWMLYRDIKLEIYQTRKKGFWETRGVYIFPAVSFVLMFIIAMLLMNDVGDPWQTVAAVLVFPGAMMSVASIAVLSVHTCARQRPEKQIERELQTCTRRDGIPVPEV